jgi:hypothetical protein
MPLRHPAPTRPDTLRSVTPAKAGAHTTQTVVANASMV